MSLSINYNANFKFDMKFFSKNLIILERLKEYLKNHPDYNCESKHDYHKLRKDILQWYVPREMEAKVDYSLENLCCQIGGVRFFDNIKLVEFSPSAVAICFTYMYYQVYLSCALSFEETVTYISETSEIVATLMIFEIFKSVSHSDTQHMVKILLTWIQREDDEIHAALRLIKSECNDKGVIIDFNVLAWWLANHLISQLNVFKMETNKSMLN